MSEYIIAAESTADLSPSVIRELDVEIVPMHFFHKTKKMRDYPDHRDMPMEKFYELLSKGEVITTAAVNINDICEVVEPYLKKGIDVLYPSFSGALSASYNCALLARDELLEKYPERKFIVIDTKGGSLGQGLLIYHAVMKKRKGMTIEQTAKWLEDNKNKLNHWFTLDDLMILKRGGRISATSALLGTALGIKPILHVDMDGRLVLAGKARGRNQSLNSLIKALEKYGEDVKNQVIFISHANAFKDAKFLETKIKELFNPKKIYINTIGPVIGAHGGPGTIALFFLGAEKNAV